MIVSTKEIFDLKNPVNIRNQYATLVKEGKVPMFRGGMEAEDLLKTAPPPVEVWITLSQLQMGDHILAFDFSNCPDPDLSIISGLIGGFMLETDTPMSGIRTDNNALVGDPVDLWVKYIRPDSTYMDICQTQESTGNTSWYMRGVINLQQQRQVIAINTAHFLYQQWSSTMKVRTA